MVSKMVPEFDFKFIIHKAGGTVFDASQYAFFGNDAVEEVELGGLEDEEDDVAPVVFEEEELQLDGEQVAFEIVGFLSLPLFLVGFIGACLLFPLSYFEYPGLHFQFFVHVMWSLFVA